VHPYSLPYLYKLRKTQWLNLAQLEVLQWQSLRHVLHHAYEYVPYYRRLFDSSGIKPADIRSLADLSLIPVTTKETLQQTPREELCAAGVRFSRLIERRTSGTTGRPLTIFLSRKEKEAQDMVQARAMLENGLRLTDRRAVFVSPWQIPQKQYWFQQLGIWRKNYFSIFDDIREQMPHLERLAPESLAGTPAILKLIALEKVRRGSSSLSPRTIFSTADLLDRGTRELLESIFQVKVVDLYGSLEFGYLAWECPQGRGYHLNMESVVTEFLPHGGDCSGQAREVVCTSLLGYAMPLIRYRLGDLCSPGRDPCPCGRGLPLINLIEGRTNDVLRLPGGRVVTPQALANAMVEFGGMIQQFRIVQEHEEHVRVKLIKGRDFGADTVHLIEKALSEILGPDARIETQVVASIERDPRGKQRAIVSNVRAAG
jgi:phenylacetate-CoA ligase